MVPISVYNNNIYLLQMGCHPVAVIMVGFGKYLCHRKDINRRLLILQPVAIPPTLYLVLLI
jgi:mRNA-degrading endonuclease toxin of MazEF toxin-antitoxin module